jgi:hypothetical protein
VKSKREPWCFFLLIQWVRQSISFVVRASSTACARIVVGAGM